LHAVFVGFVISMIFGHAPIIFPAILGLPINFRPAFYIHLILLHASLALRVIANYANAHTLRMWGGLLNEVAILLFIVMTVLSIRSSLNQKKTSPTL
jgi:succinate dehydrogenase hydrophobic anchor subunit